ncbi:MAG: CoA-binding protein [Bacillota bacterium]|nr:CoA-binding protein [Bacillota bacterium]
MGRKETPESLELMPQLPLHFRALVKPRSVAVIGASRTPGKVGHSVLSNILESGYQGRVYPVNPKEEEILGLRCYPKIEAIGEEVDLAIVAIPALAVPGVAEECGRAGVKGDRPLGGL